MYLGYTCTPCSYGPNNGHVLKNNPPPFPDWQASARQHPCNLCARSFVGSASRSKRPLNDFKFSTSLTLPASPHNNVEQLNPNEHRPANEKNSRHSKTKQPMQQHHYLQGSTSGASVAHGWSVLMLLFLLLRPGQGSALRCSDFTTAHSIWYKNVQK